jgi:hypothetical protein
MSAGNLSAGRTPALADLAERIVVEWIGEESPAPAHLAPLLQHYRDLVVTIDNTDPKWHGLDQLYAAQNSIYDQLAAAAEAKARVSQQAEAQLRRLQRRKVAHLSLTERMALAIAGDPIAAEWGPAETFGPRYIPQGTGGRATGLTEKTLQEVACA